MRLPLKQTVQAVIAATAVIVCCHCASAQAPAAPAPAEPVAAAPAVAPQPPLFKPEEIDQLVAPIALYPDPLVAQVLMASTYPIEVVEAARWKKQNPTVEGKALEDAMLQQRWDPSVKSLTAFPQVLEMMDAQLEWTQKLGDAFLAQQGDVMEGIQRLRLRAKEAGNLESSKEQKVIVEQAPVNVEQKVVVEQAAPAAAPPPQQTIIKIEQADPQVIYVPTYNPTVVYGGWPYPSYPPYSYYPPGYVAGTALLSFGVGMAVGAALWGDCNWGHGGYGHGDVDIDINRYNEFNRTNISNKNWEHNVDHRKGVQYRDQKTQQRYAGNRAATNTANREQFRGRAEQGRQDIARGGADAYRGQGRQAEAGRGGAQARPATQQRQQPSARQQPAARPEAKAGSRDGNRAASGNRATSQPRASGKQPSTFDSRGGADTRRASDRGHSSRQSSGMSSGRTGGGGGARGGGGGGGRGGGRR